MNHLVTRVKKDSRREEEDRRKGAQGRRRGDRRRRVEEGEHDRGTRGCLETISV